MKLYGGIRRSILYKYILSYISVVILTCVVIGVIFLLVSAGRLEMAAQNAQQDWLAMAANDMRTQFNTMDEIARVINVTLYYQPFYLSMNPYYDTELLLYFINFSTYSPLICEYYLYYESSDAVFSTAFKYKLADLAHIKNDVDPDVFHSLITGGQPFFSLPGQDDTAYVTIPVQFRNNGDYIDAYFIVALNKDKVLDRYRELCNTSDHLSITYRGQPLFPGTNPPETDALQAYSGDGQWCFTMPEKDFNTYLDLSDYKRTIMLVIIAASIPFLLLAAVFAYRDYCPIRRLATRFGMESQSTNNELTYLQQVLQENMEKNNMNATRISQLLQKTNRMNNILRQQSLFLILSGDYEPELDKYIENVGIHLRRAVFSTLQIEYTTLMENDSLIGFIESLSGENTSFYVSQLPRECGWGVVLAANSIEDLDMMMDILPECLAEHEMELPIRKGTLCYTIDQIAYSFMHAVTDGCYLNGGDTSSTGMDAWYESYDFLQLKTAVTEGRFNEAYELLGKIVDAIEKKCPTNLIQQYMFVHIAYHMVDYGKHLQRSVLEVDLQKTVEAQNTRSFLIGMGRILKGLCTQTPVALPSSQGIAHQIISYISKNANEYDISLASTARIFKISTKQVNALLKDAMDLTYKELVIRIRIQNAMQLLKSGVSSTDTAQQVGYMDTSHFIKLFREVTGTTPGQFRAASMNESIKEVEKQGII